MSKVSFIDEVIIVGNIPKTLEGPKIITESRLTFASTQLQDGEVFLGILMDAEFHNDPAVTLKIGWEISPDGNNWEDWTTSSRPGGPCIDNKDLRYFHSYDGIIITVKDKAFIRPFVESNGGIVNTSDFQWWVTWL